MNIIVKLKKGRFCFRPDTTWERENRDFFSPDFMRRIFFSPVVFARISRAGKCVGRKFAERYYDGANFGMLLYDGDVLAGGAPDSVAFASMADHSSILPFPLYRSAVIEGQGESFRIMVAGREVFSGAEAGLGGGFEGGVADGCEGGVADGFEGVAGADCAAVVGAGLVAGLVGAVCAASEIISLRTGDIVAMELTEPQEIILAENTGRVTVEGRFCENELFKFDIIM